jgi:hypothetical protein
MYTQDQWEQRIRKVSPGALDFVLAVIVALMTALVVILVMGVLLSVGWIVVVYKNGILSTEVQSVPFLAIVLKLFNRTDLSSKDISVLSFWLNALLPAFGLTAAVAFRWLVGLAKRGFGAWSEYRNPNLVKAFRRVVGDLYNNGKFHALVGLYESHWKTQDGYGIQISGGQLTRIAPISPAAVFGMYNTDDQEIQNIVRDNISKSEKIRRLGQRMFRILSSGPPGRSLLEIIEQYESAVGITDLRLLKRTTLVLVGMFLLTCSFALVWVGEVLSIYWRVFVVIFIAITAWFAKGFLSPSKRLYARIYGLVGEQEVDTLRMPFQGYLKRMVIAFAIVNLILQLIL